MQVSNLSLHEGGPQKTILRVQITSDDLTETTAATAQTIELFDVQDGDVVYFKGRSLGVAFADADDNGFNDVAITYGDGGDVDRFLASTQTAEEGTEVHWSAANATGYAYTAADTVDIVVGSMTAKSLSDIDTGCEISFWEIHHMAQETEQHQ